MVPSRCGNVPCVVCYCALVPVFVQVCWSRQPSTTIPFCSYTRPATSSRHLTNQRIHHSPGVNKPRLRDQQQYLPVLCAPLEACCSVACSASRVVFLLRGVQLEAGVICTGRKPTVFYTEFSTGLISLYLTSRSTNILPPVHCLSTLDPLLALLPI